MWGMPLVILWVNTEIGNSYNQNTGPVFLLSPLRGLMEELELQHFIKQPAPSPVLQKTLPPQHKGSSLTSSQSADLLLSSTAPVHLH